MVRNDDRSAWEAIDLAGLDAIIVSPGPGRPEVERDFGISRLALDTDVPLLGVCLGHQGLCHFEGGSVVMAPEAVHGRTSAIEHSGAGLFVGIPSPFEAVRYHSLMVEEVPDALATTALTTDQAGNRMVMAVEHRTRPQWGVQFHPESISTEHGRRLIGNFVELAQSVPRRRASTTIPATVIAEVPQCEEETESSADALSGRFRLTSRRLDRQPDPEAVYQALFAGGDYAFWLDSSSVIAGLSRYSILGGAGPLSEWVTATANHGVQVQQTDGTRTHLDQSVFDYLGQQSAERAVTGPASGCEFALGYVGYLGYEMKAECGGDAAYSSDLPDAAFLFCDRAVVIDHQLDETWLLVLTDRDTEPEAGTWLATAEEAVRSAPAETGAAQGGPAAPIQPVPVVARDSAEEYQELIQDCLTEIRAGETYEVCLTTMMTAYANVDPLDTYRDLRRRSPVPYGALLQFPGVDVLSASPERFLKISADGVVEAKPIKGTRRRGRTLAEDAELAEDLRNAEKDRSENLMIVDLLRNDLGKVAVVGSVHVPKAFEIESYATVHQLVSTVRAQLRDDVTPADCVRAAFPGGSMTGAPKRRTMQIIDRLERGSRGIYSGAIGYFSLSGAVDLSIVIRTMVVSGGRIRVGAGGAVVALSEPLEEVAEMHLKAKAPLDSVRATALVSVEDDQTLGDAAGLGEKGRVVL